MFAQERRNSILTLLARRRKIPFQELRQSVGASPATIRRDLCDPEAEGKVVRVHGGILHPSAVHGEPSFLLRSRRAVHVKAAMGEAGARLVKPESTVYIDAGTSCLEVARRLILRDDLTIFTHSLPVARLARAHHARIICIGGELREVSEALVGGLALQWLDQLRFDIAFVGASGLDEVDGASTTEISEASIKQSILRRSKTRILVADGSKWKVPRAVRFAAWTVFDTWITDRNLLQHEQKELSRRGLKMLTVREEDTRTKSKRKIA